MQELSPAALEPPLFGLSATRTSLPANIVHPALYLHTFHTKLERPPLAIVYLMQRYVVHMYVCVGGLF